MYVSCNELLKRRRPYARRLNAMKNRLPNGTAISCRITFQGAYEFSAVVGNTYFHNSYMGYTKKDALTKFRAAALQMLNNYNTFNK